MKKILTLFLAMTMVLGLAACGGGEPPTTAPATTAHTHTPGDWTADLTTHSRLCTVCGEAAEQGDHTLEYDICTVCGASITDWGDSKSVVIFDEFGNSTLELSYDMDGNLMESYSWNRTYDGDGNMLTEEAFVNGTLTSAYTYALDENGNLYTVTSTNHYEDGSRSTSEFDPYGNVLKDVYYEADGTLAYNNAYEYILHDDGSVHICKEYQDDVLVLETEYAVYIEEDWSVQYPAKVTTYLADGTMQITEYDADYNVLSDILCNADGSLVDHAARFDAAVCSDLIGTWTGRSELDLGGLLDVEELIIATELSLTFDETGNVRYTSAPDLEGFAVSLENALYYQYEREGLSREEADQLFLEEEGLTIAEYVQMSLDSQSAENPNEDRTLVYFVEDGTLYMAATWHSPLHTVTMTLEDGTMTLEEDGFETILTRAE